VSEIKVNNLDFILWVKTGRLSRVFYLVALLIFLIPAAIAIVTDVPFSSASSKIFICTALGFIIMGKLLTLLKKNRGDKSIPIDIGVLIGILIAFIARILK